MGVLEDGADDNDNNDLGGLLVGVSRDRNIAIFRRSFRDNLSCHIWTVHKHFFCHCPRLLGEWKED